MTWAAKAGEEFGIDVFVREFKVMLALIVLEFIKMNDCTLLAIKPSPVSCAQAQSGWLGLFRP